MNGKKIAIVALIVLLFGGGLWAFSSGSDRPLREFDRMREEMEQAAANGASREERREAWNQFREKLESLSPEQRERYR